MACALTGRGLQRAAASRLTVKKFGDSFREILSTGSTPPTEYRPKYRATCYLEKLIAPGLPRGRHPTDLSPPFRRPHRPEGDELPVNSNKRDASSCRSMKINDRGVTGGGTSGLYRGYTKVSEGGSDGGAAVQQ